MQVEEKDEWVESTIAFYRVLRDGEICVFVAGQPGVYTGKRHASAVVRTQKICMSNLYYCAGGIRRQFFSVVLEKIALSDYLKIFEGPLTGHRQIFQVSNLSSGLLRVVGVMITQSYVVDGEGFPYLSSVVTINLVDMSTKLSH